MKRYLTVNSWKFTSKRFHLPQQEKQELISKFEVLILGEARAFRKAEFTRQSAATRPRI